MSDSDNIECEGQKEDYFLTTLTNLTAVEYRFIYKNNPDCSQEELFEILLAHVRRASQGLNALCEKLVDEDVAFELRPDGGLLILEMHPQDANWLQEELEEFSAGIQEYDPEEPSRRTLNI